MNNISRLLIIFITAVCAHTARCYTLRQFGNSDGLSNSAVLSLSQDADGFLWIGTCDGMAIYDGKEITTFADRYLYQRFNGDLITDIVDTSDGSKWIMTPAGLSYIPAGTLDIKRHNQFQGVERIYCSPDDIAFVVGKDNNIYYNQNGATDAFTVLEDSWLGNEAVLNLHAGKGKLWAFTTRGITGFEISDNKTGLIPLRRINLNHKPLKGAFIHGEDVFLLDDHNLLESFDITTGISTPVKEIGNLTYNRGTVKDVARDIHGQFFIGFSAGGVLKIVPDDKEGQGYSTEEIGVKGGVFRLMPDRYQDILWIGSDGDGLYSYANDDYSIRTIKYSELGNAISHPIRAIYFDKDSHTLWLGTKGDGILQVKDFKLWQRSIPRNVHKTDMSNSKLLDNSIYAITPSATGGIWVGSDGGINYIGSDGEVSAVSTDKPIKYVHAISETADGHLWIATVGTGVIKAHIISQGKVPRLEIERPYVADNGNFSSNYFFSIHPDDHGTVWCANRGLGLFGITDHKMLHIPLQGNDTVRTTSDLFSVWGNHDELWLGTGHGLVCLTLSDNGSRQCKTGFYDGTIHTLLPDNEGYIWAATNRGLVRVSRETGNSRIYGHADGLDVVEFSDGAAYTTDGTLLFGGVNGIAILQKNPASSDGRNTASPFVPAVNLTRLNIGGNNTFLHSRLTKNDDGDEIKLAPNENTFSVSFSVPDLLAGNNYTYLYRINDSKEWIHTSTPGTISFTAMPHGDYTLDIKAVNQLDGTESAVKRLHIRISPPWYASLPAKIIYLLLAVAIIIAASRRHQRRLEKRQELIRQQIEQEQKEKSYEEKLRFFTNITHEFCTPLTLIYGPCERLLSYGEADQYVRHYVSLIKNNTERLNSLIQEIIDFRRTETGNKHLKIQPVDISGVCTDITASFDDLREQQGVTLECNIEPDIIWPTDYSCFTKIVYNLVSNAFKYTPSGGRIRMDIQLRDDKLRLSVYNTGKGIPPENRAIIFNRYSVLDNVEENATRGLSSRNGLGLAICHSMTELLQGNITIESEVNEYAEFIVTLPRLEVNCQKTPCSPSNIPAGIHAPVITPVQPLPATTVTTDTPTPADTTADSREDTRSKVLVIDDNPDILSLMTDSLSEYNVETAPNAEEAMKIIQDHAPDIIITDIMMPEIDGLALTKRIKQDKHTRQIPIIILSARNATDDKVEGLQSGADAYIPKPFTFSYLRAVMTRLLKGRNEMQEYYNTSASAYQYMHGKLVDKEAEKLVKALNAYIEANIDNPALSPESLAMHMQTSTRNLYRRMKELSLLPPNDFIKEHRISFATKLLVTTNLTIQEIIYRCGFNNRSHFYKEFDKRHGMTPKGYRIAKREA